jgi:LPXTG-motif cell wall-anchored protein
MTVSGGGFAPDSLVSSVVYSTPQKLGEARANAAGNVSMRVTLPRDLAPGPHQLQLQGVDPAGRSRVLGSTVTIVLPRTGGSTPWQTAGGTLVLILAAVALAARRRAMPLRP